jgi:hypothetical protein
MPQPEIIEYGSVIVTNDEITVRDFHVKDMIAPELSKLAVEWAIKRLQNVP